jgi:hypothetical protein
MFHSTVLFSWMRLAYGKIRPVLHQAIIGIEKKIKTIVIAYATARTAPADYQHCRAMYIQLLNLRFLFQFAIPVIQDYGISIKLNDVDLFIRSLEKLLLLFITLNTRGTDIYCRSILIFLRNLTHWKENKVP